MVDTASMQHYIRERVTIADSGCWIWQRQIEHHGYGRAKIAGRKTYAHRLAFEAFTGREIPPGREIDHLCRNRACCNPAHLDLVTHVENMRRDVRATADACINGHPRTAANSLITKQGPRCRACKREWQAARRQESQQ